MAAGVLWEVVWMVSLVSAVEVGARQISAAAIVDQVTK